MTNSMAVAMVCILSILLLGSATAMLTAWFVIRTLLTALIGR